MIKPKQLKIKMVFSHTNNYYNQGPRPEPDQHFTWGNPPFCVHIFGLHKAEKILTSAP